MIACLCVSKEGFVDTGDVGKRPCEPSWLVGFLLYRENIVNLLYTREKQHEALAGGAKFASEGFKEEEKPHAAGEVAEEGVFAAAGPSGT